MDRKIRTNRDDRRLIHQRRAKLRFRGRAILDQPILVIIEHDLHYLSFTKLALLSGGSQETRTAVAESSSRRLPRHSLQLSSPLTLILSATAISAERLPHRVSKFWNELGHAETLARRSARQCLVFSRPCLDELFLHFLGSSQLKLFPEFVACENALLQGESFGENAA
ncbi:MAG TPA: hypothetical protein VGD63_00250 [Steroidobacteraceae bacterium]